jgi:DNA-binding IclR family transcriptional regulator
VSVAFPEESTADVGKQVIARAVSVLRALEYQPAGLNMSQIARASGLPRTTVQRLVSALAMQDFLSVGESGRVRLGPALARLAAAAHADVRERIHPYLESMWRQAGETIHLWAAADHDIVLIDQIVSEREVRISLPIGTRFPFGCTAAGKALLADWPDDEIRRHGDSFLKPYTARSILSVEDLLLELADVRAQGVAYDLEEHAEDVCAIGTTLLGGSVDRLSLCIAAPVRRFHGNRDHLKQTLLLYRERINAELRI